MLTCNPSPRVISRVVLAETATSLDALDSPEAVVTYWDEVIASAADYEPQKERLVVVMLNSRLKPFAWNLVSLGSLTETCGHPRDVFRPLIVESAHAFVMIHNHPSGDPEPSQGDRNWTKRLLEGSEFLNIRMLDHVIVTDQKPPDSFRERTFSFRESGLI
jgi:DNA repair protein RadC